VTRSGVLLGLLLVASGCLQAGTGGSHATDPPKMRDLLTANGTPFNPEWAEKALSFGEGHNHNKRADHANSSTPNFEVIGYNPLITDYHGTTSGGYGCGAVMEKDGRRLSAVQSFGTDVAFILSDVTDPRNPQKIGELVMDKTQVYDLTITPDMKYVLLATSPYDTGPDALKTAQETTGVHATFRDACGNERPVKGPEAGLPFASGVVLVDITNPRNPVIQDFRFFPITGGHSVRAAVFDGKTLIMASVPNRNYPGSYYVFMDILDTAAGPKLEILSTFRYLHPDMPIRQEWSSSGTHDMYMAKHPVTGERLAYLAYGPNSLVIANIDDVRNPRVIAHWRDWGVLGEQQTPKADIYVHEALPMPDVWDGHHYTFIGEECPGRPPKTPSCLVLVLDTTKPSAPSFVGAWTLPVDVQWSEELEFSTHYVQVVNRTLFVAAYHGGMWAIDVSTPQARFHMPSIGVFMPDRDSPKPGKLKGVTIPLLATLEYRAPWIEDMEVLSDGTLVVYDSLSGLYCVRFDAAHPAPSPTPWPLTYNLGPAPT
jgi:hypothetical protein